MLNLLNLMILCLVCLLLLWMSFWVLSVLLIFFAKYLWNIDLRVERVGLLSFGNVYLHVPGRFSLTIQRAWISSSLLSTEHNIVPYCDVNNCHFKLLETCLQGETCCLVDFSLSLSMSLFLNKFNVIPPEPSIYLTDGLAVLLRERRADMARKKTDLTENIWQRISQYLPKEFYFECVGFEAVADRTAVQRCLFVSLGSITLKFSHIRTAAHLAQAIAQLHVTNLQAKSRTSRIASLKQLICSSKVEEDGRLTFSNELDQLHFVYNHDDLSYWLLRRTSEPSTVQQTTTGSASDVLAAQIFGRRHVVIKAEVTDSSLAMADAECSGLKTGLKRTKFLLELKESLDKSDNPNFKVEGEASSLFCILTDEDSADVTLDANKHHRNTLFFLNLFMTKVNTHGKDSSAEAAIDGIQIEASPFAVGVIDTLTSQLEQVLPRRNSANRSTTYTQSAFNYFLVKLNLQITSLNIFLTNKSVLTYLKVDSITASQRNAEGKLGISDTKLVYFKPKHSSVAIRRAADIADSLLRLPSIEITYNRKSRSLDIGLHEEIWLTWHTALHMCIYTTLRELSSFISSKIDVSQKETKVSNKPEESRTVLAKTTTFRITSEATLTFCLSHGHKISLHIYEFVYTAENSAIAIETELVNVTCDGYDVLRAEQVNLTSQHHSKKVEVERRGAALTQATNRGWQLAVEDMYIVFEHKFNFAACYEEIINMNKWRKMIHNIKKKAFTSTSPLPPDITFKTESFTVQINDDPFEVRLNDNYILMLDEIKEREKRVAAMARRIHELRHKHGLLSDDKIGELYQALNQRSSQVYLDRSKQFYNKVPMRKKLFTWLMTDVEVTIMADPSLHGTENCVKNMKEIDDQSPFPSDLEFTTLWCRMIKARLQNWTIKLRDYPQSALEIEEMEIVGRLLGAEQVPAPRAVRTCTVSVDEPWGNVSVERFMPKLKFYHDFLAEIKEYEMAYGACWEPVQQQFGQSFNLISAPSKDPSRVLPFWDKVRLLLHGRLTLKLEQMTWLYHVSTDPYNKTEFLGWNWNDLVLVWSNAKWIFRGDLEVLAHTASKYDDCKILELPNLLLCLKLDWQCLGDCNDHHSVMPCAPNKLPEFSLQEHDSYSAFRSQNFNMTLNFETKEKRLGDYSDNGSKPGPSSCQTYASTMRFLDRLQTCIARVSRPIRRGSAFNNIVPKKVQFTRHVRKIQLNVKINAFSVSYWMSFAKQFGIQMQGASFNMKVSPTLVTGSLDPLRPIEDGLKHRPEPKWTISYFTAELHDATILLCGREHFTQEGEKISSLRGPIKKTYFLSIEKLLYKRDETHQDIQAVLDSSQLNAAENHRHKLQMHNIKGAWTQSTRDIAVSLWDGFQKSSSLRKNLAADALKAFKVERSQTPAKLTNSPSPLVGSSVSSCNSLDKLEHGHGFSMLKKLVSEQDRIVSVDEESPGGNIDVEKLHGIAACRTEDVFMRNWHIEIYNSQMVLKATETAGYVIISAAHTSIESCEHQPVWVERQLKRKTTWRTELADMQYYAPVRSLPNFTRSDIKSRDDVMWLTREDICEYNYDDPAATCADMREMLSSGQSVGAVVNRETGQDAVQLQRIISRSRCEIFYADYGDVDQETVAEVPPPPLHETEGALDRKEEGVDSVTLLHHDLKICTNSSQYTMVLDIVNNLLLHVEPKKKEVQERHQNMRFKLQFVSIDDQKTPILQLQNDIRQLLSKMRQLEKDIHYMNKELSEDYHSTNSALIEQLDDLEHRWTVHKEQLLELGEELGIMVNVYRESQLQHTLQRSAKKTKASAVVRRYDVCFKHAEWRMTEEDGQIGIADLVLKNFLYSKVNADNESGSHQLELGWVKVTNLLAGALYKDVLVPQARQQALRIMCSFSAPVGGIAIKDHFEVNVSPLYIQLTHRFYTTVIGYFFAEDRHNKAYEGEFGDSSTLDHNSSSSSSASLTPANKAKKKDKSTLHKNKLKNPDDIDIMKERAARNNTFIYIKIPEVPLRVSYKGQKEKNIEDLHDFIFNLPTLEYHNQTMTWLDLLLSTKNDCKKRIIAQAIKQKLHVRSRLGVDHVEQPVDAQQEEEEKVRMLLGPKLAGAMEKPAYKRSLFGKKQKEFKK